jgi:hypothetical protein
MKKSTLLVCAGILLSVFKINAADLCVEENGNFGCYSTITAAHNAAANGDRIIITPKAGNAPYVENLTITKSLQFLCAVEGGQYTVQGNCTITPAIGRTITIIGMNNLQGNITATGNSPAGARCKVSMLGCSFGLGSINLSFDNFDITLASCVISDGNVSFKYGRLLGNEISTNALYAIYLNEDITPTNDTVLIIGNKCNGVTYGMQLATTNQFYYVANNYMNGIPNYVIYCYTTKVSTLGRSTILNNTINYNGVLSGYGIYVTPNTGAYVDVLNNLILAAGGIAIYNPGIYVMASYNVISAPCTITYDDGTNNLSSNTTLDANGRPNVGTDAINGASPDFSYYDLNLTVGDAGCYGGSLTLDNFFPLVGGARVYMVYVPRRVNVSGTINIKADGFDR